MTSIDFSHNKLPTLDYFSTLETTNLKSINLEGNRLELRQLEKLAGLRLVSFFFVFSLPLALDGPSASFIANWLPMIGVKQSSGLDY